MDATIVKKIIPDSYIPEFLFTFFIAASIWSHRPKWNSAKIDALSTNVPFVRFDPADFTICCNKAKTKYRNIILEIRTQIA